MKVNLIKVKCWFVVIWLLPIFITLFYEVFFTEFDFSRLENFFENILFVIAMLITVLWFTSVRVQYILQSIYYVVFLVCLFLETTFYQLFKTQFSESAIFIALETNTAEAKEFLQFYIDIPIILFFLSLVACLVLFFKNKSSQFNLVLLPKKKRLFVGFIFISILVFLKLTKLIVPNFPYLVARASYEYYSEQKKMASFNIDTSVGSLTNVKYNGDHKKVTYVLVIGESTNKNHLGVYGYYRQTTPNIENRKEDFLIYNNVISPHAYTIGSLKEALTLNSFKKNNESSIIQLMNQAGFKTFWFSNQRPIGQFESLVTKISKASDVCKYTNSAISGSKTPYDEVLLPYLDQALKDPAAKKFIVLHILGTHLKYKDRFPSNFKKFTEKPKGKFTSPLALSRRNNYDNAILYNDYILEQVINRVDSNNEASYVFYFSDHGEEMYEVRDFAGHIDNNPTKGMFEVPFLLWQSNKFKANSEFHINTEKPYVLDDLLHSLADLSDISFEELVLSKSIFSEKFVPKQRIVGEGIDFDTFNWDTNNE
ncbi:heptose-I-phosphate ethanolaminephosphotransferase [Mesonia phycicola]|uniref:Heptose-I-phosphate ethanolaminephosphotransferase n=1 Tax=Mesonia phycicola TaxID=579105 RepID=A0A1M6GIZ9_9FLAO|nr:sulfatase-like hydrolase/transferase [Mesonia phycicola]SHJ09945.1 heptose-I-phosphate ethanolaminephosphotransferase [Mesonia phycicola]